MSTILRPTIPAAPGLPLDELISIVRNVAGDPGVWQPRLQIPVGTDRWWTRLSSDPRVDVWLLSWLPGQRTDLHDHGASAAAFSVVRGELVELRTGLAASRKKYLRRPGPVTYVGPGVIHDVRGAGHGPAVSIHAYSPPLREMNYYEASRTGGLDVVRSVRTHEPEEELVRWR